MITENHAPRADGLVNLIHRNQGGPPRGLGYTLAPGDTPSSNPLGREVSPWGPTGILLGAHGLDLTPLGVCEKAAYH